MSTTFTVPTYAELRDQILLNIRNQRPDAWLSVDDDEVVRANAVAAAIEGAYLHQRWILRQFFPQTAVGAFLDMQAQLRGGMTRKPATSATGTILATGTPAAVVPVGSLATRAGVTWAATEEVVIGVGGTVDVPVQCTRSGAIGNLSAGTSLTWASSPAGVLSALSVVALGGGTDQETDDELRSRLLDALRQPPGVGLSSDYVRWALEVDGVTTATVYPKRRGVGSVDIAITSGGSVPSPAIISAALDHIEAKAPAHVDVAVFAPTVSIVDVSVLLAVSGVSFGSVEDAAESVIALYFASLAPGKSFVVAHLSALLMAIPGVVDVSFITPTENQNADEFGTIEWLVAGVVSVGELV